MMPAEERQASSDERLAQQLQEAEMGQRAEEPARNVVQGKPVGQAPPTAPPPPTAPMMVGASGPVALPPHGAAVIIEALPHAEALVLNYRLAVSCFAFLDIITTVMNVLSLTRGYSWGLYGLILLIGPLCGIIGARTLNRMMIAVYLAFCALKVVFEIVMAVTLSLVSTFAFLWMLIIVVIQIWITKLVATFWQALGGIAPARLKELASNDEAGATMVYW